MGTAAANAAAVRATIVACLFYAAFAGFLQWLPVWLLAARGFSGAQLGLAVAWAGVGRIFVGPLTSAWADGRRDRGAPLLALTAVSLAALLALAAVPVFGISFALALTLEISFWGMIAFLEAAILRLATPATRPSYGVARGLASLAFVAGNIAVGMLVDRFGDGAIWAWLTVATALLLAAILLLPAAPVSRGGRAFGTRLAAGLAMLRIVPFALLIFGCGIIQSAHQYYYIFGTRLWMTQMGLSATLVGWLFAAGVIAEAAFLMLFAGPLARVHPASLMIAGGIGAVLRWGAMATAPPLLWLVPLQLLHAASFAATFLGAMRGIRAMWGDDHTPTAQMMFLALATAPAQAAASYLSGRLFDAGWGARGYLAMAAIAAGGLALVVALRLRGPLPALARSGAARPLGTGINRAGQVPEVPT